jgi:hypothetical protein
LHQLQPVENHQRLLIPVWRRIPWIIRQALVPISKWILRRVKLRHSILKPPNPLYQNQIRKGVKTTTYKRRGSLSKLARAVGARTSLCRIAPTKTSLIANVRLLTLPRSQQIRNKIIITRSQVQVFLSRTGAITLRQAMAVGVGAIKEENIIVRIKTHSLLGSRHSPRTRWWVKVSNLDRNKHQILQIKVKLSGVTIQNIPLVTRVNLGILIPQVGQGCFTILNSCSMNIIKPMEVTLAMD